MCIMSQLPLECEMRMAAVLKSLARGGNMPYDHKTFTTLEGKKRKDSNRMRLAESKSDDLKS